MATYTITLNLGNAAFTDGDESQELAKILRRLANKLDDQAGAEAEYYRLLDTNGNHVGDAVRS